MTETPKDRVRDGEVQTPPSETPLLDTVRDPEPVDESDDADEKGEPAGDHFA